MPKQRSVPHARPPLAAGPCFLVLTKDERLRRTRQASRSMTLQVRPSPVADLVPAVRLLAQTHFQLAPLVVEGIPMMVRWNPHETSNGRP